MFTRHFSRHIAEMDDATGVSLTVAILFTLSLCISLPAVSGAERCLLELSLDEQQSMLPELKPLFDPQRTAKFDWKKVYEAANELAAEYPVSTTAGLFARYHATRARFTLAWPPGELPPSHEVLQIKRTLLSLADAIDDSFSVERSWLIAELRHTIEYDIAVCDFALGNYDRAIQALTSVVERNPTCKPLISLALKFMGMSYAAKGEAENGIAQIKSLAEKYPSPWVVRSLAYHRCAILQLKLGEDSQQVLDFCNEAIRSTTDEQQIKRIKSLISMVEQKQLE